MNRVKVGVVVPTRNNRPLLLAQCRKYIQRQTHVADHLFVVDYEPKKLPYDLSDRYRYGFERLSGMCDLIVLMEDDDWYPATYIEQLVRDWEESGRPDIFGYSKTIYYHIFVQKYAIMDHPGRASAFCTAITPRGAEMLQWDKIDPLWFDIGAWEHVTEQGKAVAMDVPGPKFPALGIKHGMAQGAGAGHRGSFYRGERENVDFGMQFFKKHVGGDFRFYAEIIGRRSA